jgi:hypothetical protein
MTTEPCVLLLSHGDEPLCTDAVAGAVARRGARPLRLDTDEYPGDLDLRGELDGERAIVLHSGRELRVDAVWLWRLWPPRLDARLSAAHREAAHRECGAALTGLLGLIDAPWIDALDKVRAADDKARQLRIVAKLQTALAHTMGGGGLPTRLLRREDLDALGGLRHCPMIFQQYVPKAMELRIAWADGRAFAGALDGARCGVDWRYESTASWQPYTLPGPVHDRLTTLMTRLELRQGAIDMIVTPAGDHVFLEVNPTGEWGMLQRELGLPIGEALADALLRLADAPRHERNPR